MGRKRNKKKRVAYEKERKERQAIEKYRGLIKAYRYFKTYGLAAIVLFVSYLAYHIRMYTAHLKYFTDPDTFFHYEMFRQAVRHGIPTYFARANPPFGVDIHGQSLGIYTIPAWTYRLIFQHLGYSELTFYKMWAPMVGALTVIAIYLLGRKLHSDWAGFWAALFVAFSYANFTKTMSGNGRGEGPFMMFFLYSLTFMAYYLDQKKFNWKKVLWAVLFILTAWAFMSAWEGGQFGLGILTGFMALNSVALFIFGKVDDLKRFSLEFYPVMAVILAGALALNRISLIGFRRFTMFNVHVYIIMVILTIVMIYGGRFLNYTRRAVRVGVVSAFAVVGAAGAFALFGSKVKAFMGGAYQSNPLYQTVAELQRTHWGYVKNMFSIHYAYKAYSGYVGQDGLLYVLSVVGFMIVLYRLIVKLYRGNFSGYKEILFVTYYLAANYLLWTAVRFSFQASGAVTLLAGVLIGEIILILEKLNDRPSMKAIYAIVLALLLVPMPVVAGQDMSKMAKGTGEQVPVSWQESLHWLRENSNSLASATSWWDYGYWIESSLLGDRRSATDGGHAYDRRYLVGKFFSHTGNAAEVDFEAWELNYMIAWQMDIWKFNAISYLGGAITHGEYTRLPMFQIVRQNQISYDKNLRAYYVVTQEGNLYPYMTYNMLTGQITPGPKTGNLIPYVLLYYGTYGIMAYKKIAFSDYTQLAFGITDPFNVTASEKLRANFQLVHADKGVMTYRFHPFAIYRIDVLQNKTWRTIYTTLTGQKKFPTGQQTFKLYISAFGRDVKNGTIIFEAYNGSKLVYKKTVATDVNVNYLDEKPVTVTVDVPKATSYTFLLIQNGPVGVVNSPIKVNGKEVNPSYVMAPGKSGTMKFTEAFEKSYKNAELTLRASVVYYVTPNGTDIYKSNFILQPHQDIIAYIPVKTMNVVAGNNTITASVSVPSNVFTSFIDELHKKYGKDVVIYKKRLEPVFIAKKTYVMWVGTAQGTVKETKKAP
ncbi:MAG: peptide transporter [Thermococci archaeon]|nr:peptide transporter [Thermococci archaeon]